MSLVRARRWLGVGLFAILGSWVRPAGAGEIVAPDGAGHPVPHVLWSLPFGLLLLAVAVLPVVPVAQHWWEQNRTKLFVGLALGAVVLVYYGFRGFGYQDAPPGAPTVRAVLEHAILRDFVPFIALLAGLYVISGGLHLEGDLRAQPAVNTAFLAVGAVLASLIGTTGASMVLIRPVLQTNAERRHVRHTVVFFIFLVSNIGGCLLPIGDPPLFLGYLRGVPFLWTLTLWPPWLCCVAILLAAYYAWDRVAYGREDPADLARDETQRTPLRLRGAINLLWLLGVVLATALIPRADLRTAAMIVLTVLSLATTPRGLRQEVAFSYAPIAEVAALFLGIFLTVQVPIEILQARGRELGPISPALVFWATGGLSGVLDNAPTYLVFFEAAKTLPTSGARVVTLLTGGTIRQDLLAAVSLGSVFMGANTYIGNGPNFMVKAIAEEQGVRMPGFFGYMLYSGGLLIPLFLLVTAIFFR
jgi:Na+/H+ antiporter NhaD/arsenite permease-like protein